MKIAKRGRFAYLLFRMRKLIGRFLVKRKIFEDIKQNRVIPLWNQVERIW